MKHLIVYAGKKEGNTIIGNLAVETAHRKLRAENRTVIEAALKEQGIEDVAILNVFRVRSW